MTTKSTSLEGLLRRVIDGSAAPVTADEAISIARTGSGRIRRSRVGLSLGIAVVILALLGGTAMLLAGNGSGPDELAVVGPSEPVGQSDPSVPLAPIPSTSLGGPLDGVVDGWESLPPVPLSPREGAATAYGGGYFLIWGGRDARSADPFSDGALLDFESLTWAKLPSPPMIGRSDATAVWSSGQFIVSGGWSPEDPSVSLDDVVALDPVNLSWQNLVNAPQSQLSSPAILTANGSLIYVGGYAGILGTPTRSVNVLDLDTSTWTRRPDAPVSVVRDPDARAGSLASPSILASDRIATVSIDGLLDGEAALSLHLMDLNDNSWRTVIGPSLSGYEVLTPEMNLYYDGTLDVIYVFLRTSSLVVLTFDFETETWSERIVATEHCGDGQTWASAIETAIAIHRCSTVLVWTEGSLGPQEIPAPPSQDRVQRVIPAEESLIAIDFTQTGHGQPELPAWIFDRRE